MKLPSARRLALPGIIVLCLAPRPLSARPANSYLEIDLVSDIPGRAAFLDPNLINPWGIAYSPTSPIWVADNGTGVSTLYNGSGVQASLVVGIAPPAGGNPPSTPTGAVYNGGTGFQVGPNQPARFIFATEQGTVSGWNPGASLTSTILKVDNSPSSAIYKGLAIGNNGSGDFLYAANFHSGAIDVFNTTFASTTLTGSFMDPTLPAGYAPFNIENLGGALYVTYALQNGAKHDDVAGAGHGFVDKFDLNGNFLQRLVSQGALNSPWGLSIAPAGFGALANDLLVGNFGDGTINAYDPVTGAFIDTLRVSGGTPLQIDGLWGLAFGNGGSGGATDSLYFTAGISGDGSKEDHGLFGLIESDVPEIGTGRPVLFGALALVLFQCRRVFAKRGADSRGQAGI